MNDRTLYLTGVAWQPWAAARTLFDGYDCLWIDVDGPHRGLAPTGLPVGATHLWAWRSDQWLRVRIDAGNVAAVRLSSVAASGAQPTTARRHQGRPWGKDYERTAPWEPAVTFMITDTPVPLTFVAGLGQ